MKIDTAAKALIFNESGQVLLLRRSDTDDSRPGEFDLPGGEVEFGEDFAQAVSRETLEETGIAILRNDFKLVYLGTSFSEKHNKSVNRLLFKAVAMNPVVVLSHEHSAFDWVSLDKAIEIFQHPFYGAGMKYVKEHGL